MKSLTEDTDDAHGDHHGVFRLAEDICIREVEPLAAESALLSTYVEAFSGPPWNEAVDHHLAYHRLVEKTIEAKGYLLSLNVGNSVVGGAQFYNVVDHPDTAAQLPAEFGKDTYLSEVFIAKNCRGSGLGSRLVDAVEQAVASLSFQRIVLRTHPEFEPLLRFYRERGYRQVGMSNPDNGDSHRPVFSKPVFTLQRRAA